MKVIHVIVICFVILGFAQHSALGETWNDYLEAADSLNKMARFDSAIVLGNLSLKIVEEKYGTEDTNTALVLNKLGSYYTGEELLSIATPMVEKSLEIRRNVYGPNHPDVARSQYTLASCNIGLGKYSKAEMLLKEALIIWDGLPDPFPDDVVKNLNKLSMLYIKMLNPGVAESYNKRAISICEDHDHMDIDVKDEATFCRAVLALVQLRYTEADSLAQMVSESFESRYGKRHPVLCNVFKVRAIANLGQGKSIEAEEFLNQSLTIGEEIFRPGHPDRARNLMAFGMLRLMQGRFAETDSLCRISLEMLEQLYGAEHPDIAQCLTCIAAALRYQGKYDEAKPLFERAMAIKEKSQGAASGDMAAGLQNLAGSYCDAGKYIEAESLLVKSLKMYERMSETDKPEFILCLINLSNVYIELGKYVEADSLMRRLLTSLEAGDNEEQPYAAEYWVTYASLHASQGRYEEAKSLLDRALGIVKNAEGTNQLLLARVLQNIAIILCWQDKYPEAEPIIQEALEAYRSIGEEEHPESAGCLNIIGALNALRGDYEKAEEALREGLAIRKKAYGSLHHYVSVNLDNIGEIYAYQGRYEEAVSLHEQAQDIRTHILGEGHPYHAEGLETYANLIRLQQKWSKSLEKTAQAFHLRQKGFRKNCYILSENDALAYSQKLRRCANAYLSCYHDSDIRDSVTARQAAEIILSSKGQVSDVIFERRKPLVTDPDSAVAALADSLRRIQYELSYLFVHGPGDNTTVTYRHKIDSLSGLAEYLESNLARKSASFRQFQDRRDLDSRRLSSSIPPNSVLIEFYRYDYVRFAVDNSVQRYMAAIFLPDANPVIVEVGSASDVDPVIEAYRNHLLHLAGSEQPPTIIDKQEYLAISKNLYEQVWQPIEAYTVNRDMVFIAPDGALNLISFAGLVNDEDEYLIEHYPIQYLTSGRDVIRLADIPASGTSLFAIGDPDYDAPVHARLDYADTVTHEQPAGAVYAMRSARSGCGALNSITVSPLPGTRREVQQIVERWQMSVAEPAAVYYGAQASEERFKSEAPGKRVIHLATHGYYLQGVCQDHISRLGFDMDVEYAGENPLLFSGLFLAGANRHENASIVSGSDDGILTAYEVSGMNFEGTELVVLSACETGLGEVKEGEGVYGLRRAFQMAGARTVISALWPVSDKVTAEMMGQLYDRGTETLPERMRRIQIEKIRELRAANEVDHPYSWGAFIALGDWR